MIDTPAVAPFCYADTTETPCAGAEYSRTFMRLACHYLEAKSIHPIDPSEVPSGNGAPIEPAISSDASSATRTDSEEVQSVGPERVSKAWFHVQLAADRGGS